MLLNEILTSWYRHNKRDLPWRNINSTYFIWVSEIILQQTRVDQGIEYYNNFIQQFPTLQHLAKADENEVLKRWQGLGYYSRARNMHLASKTIVNELNGIFPSSYQQLLKLKGIGEYTAAAIASISFNEPVVAIDGNVCRVMSRIFNISAPIDTAEGKQILKSISAKHIDKNNPGEYNQAVMEFGAIICTPKTPRCSECPAIAHCMAYKNKTIEARPVKSKQTKQRNRFLNYLVFDDGQYTFLNKRTGNDIWKNLYDFPVIETEHALDTHKLIESNKWQLFFGNKKVDIINVSQPFKHILSHQIIMARFITLKCHSSIFNKQPFLKIKKSEFENFAIPKLIDNFLLSK